MEDYTDKVAMVTGAGGGLGAAVVRAYLEAGALVAAVDRSPGNASSADGRLVSITADLGDEDGARAAASEALKLTGRIDALAHIAGGFSPGGTAPGDTAAPWEKMMHLNLTLAHNVIRAVLPGMIDHGEGSIVAVGSRAGIEPAAGLSAYCASKAALHMLVRCVAEEVKNSGVTANAVLPSVIDTPANRTAMPDADHSAWVKPEAIAAQILWLTSPAAADINGALIPVYGRA